VYNLISFFELNKNNINKKKIIICNILCLLPFLNFTNMIYNFYYLNSLENKNTYIYYLNFFECNKITNNSFIYPTTGISLLYLLNKYNIKYDIIGFDSLMNKNIDYKHYDNSYAELTNLHNFNNEYDYFQKNKKNVNTI